MLKNVIQTFVEKKLFLLERVILQSANFLPHCREQLLNVRMRNEFLLLVFYSLFQSCQLLAEFDIFFVRIVIQNGVQFRGGSNVLQQVHGKSGRLRLLIKHT